MEQAAEIWGRINALIKEKNTTQNAISTNCGFNPRRIQNLSGGNRLPDAVEITKIAQALDTTVEYLTTGEKSTPKPDTSAILATLEQAIQQVKEL